jgi:adenosylcobinamide-GDP ribazoletransferase
VNLNSRLRVELNILLSAVMFLTRLPVAKWVVYDEMHLKKSTKYFPVVGALVGVLGACMMWVAAQFFSPMIAAMLSISATIFITGAFHEDGLADASDGFGGGLTKDRVLEIMKDSRIGAYGAIALWLGLTLKLLLLSELITKNIIVALAATIAAHTFGRCSSVMLIYSLPYVRSESSTSKPFADSVTSRGLIGALIFTALLAAGLLQFKSIFGLCAGFLSAYCCGVYFRKRIGGITGDALGAANQASELSFYLGILFYITLEPLIRLLWIFF